MQSLLGTPLRRIILLCLDKHHEKMGVPDKLVIGVLEAGR